MKKLMLLMILILLLSSCAKTFIDDIYYTPEKITTKPDSVSVPSHEAVQTSTVYVWFSVYDWYDEFRFNSRFNAHMGNLDYNGYRHIYFGYDPYRSQNPRNKPNEHYRKSENIGTVNVRTEPTVVKRKRYEPTTTRRKPDVYNKPHRVYTPVLQPREQHTDNNQAERQRNTETKQSNPTEKRQETTTTTNRRR